MVLLIRIVTPAEAFMSAASHPEPVETGILAIDLGALAENWRLLAARSEGAQCAAVIKADGYGIGLEAAMRTLLAAGCKTFFVANVAEGERARAISGEAIVYVLEGLAPGAAQRLAQSDLRPTLSSLAEIEEWAALGKLVGRQLEAALHFDTGMNRLGLAPEEAAEAATAARGVSVTLVMSHFVCSQWPEHACNARQIADFEKARAHFPGVAASLCNSSGIFLPSRPHLDLTRPGYALYGGNPLPHAENPMRPVVRLDARILATRAVAPGQTVGYDASWTAARPSRLATIGVGYADGVPAAASNGPGRRPAEAIVGGVRCPFVGRVSMDFVALDVTDAPPEATPRGALVELLGETIGVDELARRSGTIGYEILTRLGRRFARRYAGA
jgi:alanine racemase